MLGLDLSAGSTLVASNPADNAAEPFARRVFAAMREAGAAIGAGGYDEARLIYAADAFATGAVTDERRTIHIGLDLTLPAGSPLYAPLDGVVHGFEDAAARLDYGPVIVLRHDIPGDEPRVVLHALRASRSRSRSRDCTSARRIKAGERFAAIGAPPEQRRLVAARALPDHHGPARRAVQLQRRRAREPARDVAQPLARSESDSRNSAGALRAHVRRTDVAARSAPPLLGGNVSLSYGDQPLQDRARLDAVPLRRDRPDRIIDAYNNVPHVGHAHPARDRAVAAQLATLNTNTRYLQRTSSLEYAAELTARFPAPLERLLLHDIGQRSQRAGACGSRARTRGQRDLIVMDAAYHGHTTTLIDISPYKHGGPGGHGAPDWVHVVADSRRLSRRLPG